MVTFVPGFVSQQMADYEHEFSESQKAARQRLGSGDHEALHREGESWKAEHPQPQVTLSQVADHIEYMRKVAGVDHIGLGGDFDGISAVIKGLEDVSTYPALFAELVHRGWSDEDLRKLGYGLLIHDAYRPWYVTKMFWDATPDSLRDFVADPSLGSRHNRGAAVDLTLYDMRTGEVIAMPSGYDEFSERAFPNYPGGTTRQRWHRDLLRRIMEARGFTVNENEWWHFDYDGWRNYPIGTATFEEILARRPHREAQQ
jgi:hypothetical protein